MDGGIDMTTVVMTLEKGNLLVASGNESDYYILEESISSQVYELFRTFQLVQLITRRDILFIAALVSVIGNCLIIIVLGQKRNRHHTTSVYLINLAISDMIVSAGSFFSWYDYHWPVNESTALCRVALTIRDIASFSNPWVLCVIAIERAVSIWIPHKVKSMCTVRRAKVIMLILWLFCIAMLSSFRQVVTTAELEGSVECYIDPKFLWVVVTFNIVYILFVILVPYIILVTSTVVIVRGLFNRKVNKTQTDNGMSVTKKLLFVILAYFILITPLVIQEVYLYVVQMFYSGNITRDEFVKITIFINIGRALRSINSAVNFFIYFFAGSRFRNETIAFFKCLSCRSGS